MVFDYKWFVIKKHGQKLYDAGLHGSNISLDVIDDTLLQSINNRNIKATTILEQIDYATSIGLNVKVNVVIQKVLTMIKLYQCLNIFKDKHIGIRFIEFMDGLTHENAW